MPPNCWHEVYTPTASTVRGGHFLPFHTLHLTEVSRHFDQVGRQCFTNNTHISVPTALARMTAMLVQDPEQGKFILYMPQIFSESLDSDSDQIPQSFVPDVATSGTLYPPPPRDSSGPGSSTNGEGPSSEDYPRRVQGRPVF